MDLLPLWWPVLLVLAGVGGSAVRADSHIEQNTRRIETLETAFSTVPERLARMEATQEAQGQQLDRIEGRLEALR